MTCRSRWLGLMGGLMTVSAATVSVSSRAQVLPLAREHEPLSEIIIHAPEPRFVAPTRRDRIGRIWAPVMINGHGPFRLVLDTGASRSAVNAHVAQVLGVAPDDTQSVLLRGVTGSAVVPTIRATSFSVGDVIVSPVILPIVADALGGADGILGTEGFTDRRLYVDFGRDLISITRSRGIRAQGDLISVPLERSSSGLLEVRVLVDGVPVHAIIDTGGQATIGNEAMRQALVRRRARGTPSEVIDVTTTSQEGEAFPSSPIHLGSIQIQGARVTYGDMHIFAHWHLIKEPALLIGMDTIGLLDVFIVDYRRHELQLRTRPGGV